MTTIVYDNGVMASDGKMTLGDMVIKLDTEKVFWINNHLVGICGRARAISTFVSWLQKMTDYHIVNQEVGDLVDLVPPVLEDDDGYTALVVTPNRQVLMYEGNTPIDMGNDISMSVGSGSAFALAAMKAGASAEEAVKIACELDVYSGGEITVVKFEDEPQQITREVADEMTKEQLIEAMFGPKEQEIVDKTPESYTVQSELVYIKKWDINDTIVLYKYTPDESGTGYWFEVDGCELENAEVEFTCADMREGCGFEKQELISICARMGIDIKSKDTYEQLVKKISKEVQSAVAEYELDN